MYIPEVGHSVCARRKKTSSTEPNMIVGPVTRMARMGCIIHNNRGKENAKAFYLFLEEWDFDYLFLTKDETVL